MYKNSFENPRKLTKISLETFIEIFTVKNLPETKLLIDHCSRSQKYV